jgi:hypothetical protein
MYLTGRVGNYLPTRQCSGIAAKPRGQIAHPTLIFVPLVKGGWSTDQGDLNPSAANAAHLPFAREANNGRG